MKQFLFILSLLLLGCTQSNKRPSYKDCQKAIEISEMEFDKLFQENGKLKEEYESAKEYIQLLVQENEYLKNERDSIRFSLKN